jgi:hypothetical protein
MGGVRIGGRATIGRVPDIPILVRDNAPTNTFSLWQVGNRATPIRMDQTAVAVGAAGNPQLSDPQREPTTGLSVVYCRYNIVSTLSRDVRLCDWADTTDIQLYTETGSDSVSLQPIWAPDGSKILFRAQGAGSFQNLLKTMNPDGSGVTTIYTGPSGTRVNDPSYSFDGSKIAIQAANEIIVMNADGSSPTAIYTGSGSDIVTQPAWQNNGMQLAFLTMGNTFTSNQVWRVCNDDGTGLATWLTISRAGGDDGVNAIVYSWMDDDVNIVTLFNDDPSADFEVTYVDSGGLNPITPTRVAAGGNQDSRPISFTGFTEGIERIWWTETVGLEVVSMLPDGSDYRVDWDGSGLAGNSFFHGFRGDTLNI